MMIFIRGDSLQDCTILQSILFYFLSEKGDFKLKRKISCVLCMLLTVIYMCSIMPVKAASSESTNIIFNNSSKKTTVSGYDSKLGNLYYRFSGTLKFTFSNSNQVRTAFNRYSINYSTESYIQGTIKYRSGWGTRSEVFYLEPGTNVTFASFIDGYLDSTEVSRVSELTFTPLHSSSGVTTLAISSISTTYYNLPETQTVYLENEQYKIGVALFWGGGINYIEDKLDNDPEISNLLNHCDTGRLVQQSYYGTSEPPYVCATYSGTTWSYNPVQGGDQYNNKSKLIDFEITDTYIAVKSRPLDWAQNNLPTISYMENRYILENGLIRVDNRFIDFSGYNHPPAHQELPAFYTISHLDKFSFYDGSYPWRNDYLTEKKDLPFWGGNPDCYFNVKEGNTETWCAWTNSTSDYGIGLYTPGVEILLAGRFNYNGSKDPANGATNYVAPLKTFKLPNFESFEYSYLIASGTTDVIRAKFTQQKDFLSEGVKETHKLSADATNGKVSMSGHEDDTYLTTSVAEDQTYSITFTPDKGYVLGSVTRSDGVEVSYVKNSTEPFTFTGSMPAYDLSYNVIFNAVTGEESTLTQHSYSSYMTISGFSANSDVESQLSILNTDMQSQGLSAVTLYKSDGTVAQSTDTFTTNMYFELNGTYYYTTILGDTTSDGNIDISDAQTAYKYLRGKTSLSGGAITAANASGDKLTNIMDIMLILNMI